MMENWEKKLNEKLKNRQRRDHTLENFLKVQGEIINPTFEKIKGELYEYFIDCRIGMNECSLCIELLPSTPVITIELKVKGEGEIMAITTIHSIIGPKSKKPDKSIERVILLSDITKEFVGDLVVTTLEKVKIFDN